MADKPTVCTVCEIHAESVFRIDGMDCREEVAILERRLKHLPGLEELKGAGFIEGRVPSDFSVPVPSDADALREDEDPLDDDLLQPLDMHQTEAGEE